MTEYNINQKVERHSEAYRSSYSIVTLEIEWRQGDYEDFKPLESESLLEQFARQIATSIPATKQFYKDKTDPLREWHEKFVEYVTVTGPGVVEVKLVQPYLD